MNLNENLLRSFAKAVNATNEKETKLYYGTITKVEEVDGVRVPYVHLDGSEPNSETTLVEGTEVMVDDRVIVTIENHKAVVMSNITSPASARTASNYMDLVEEEEDIEHGYEALSGLKIGDMLDDEHDFNVLITANGVYIRDGRKVLSHYTGDGIIFGEQTLVDGADSYSVFSRLAGGWLEMFTNYTGGEGGYDSRVAIAPGMMQIEGTDGSVTEIYGGDISTEDLVASSIHGDLNLGTCVVPVAYTSSGTAMYFTIPLPGYISGNLTHLFFNCVVRCNGHYLIQFDPTQHNAASIETGTTSHVYVYNGSGDVEKSVTLTATKTAVGIYCTITYANASDLASNGCNNHAAVGMLYNISATFA